MYSTFKTFILRIVKSMGDRKNIKRVKKKLINIVLILFEKKDVFRNYFFVFKQITGLGNPIIFHLYGRNTTKKNKTAWFFCKLNLFILFMNQNVFTCYKYMY